VKDFFVYLHNKKLMISSIIQPSTLDFLKRLSKNNNRDWFNAHKDQYIIAQENMIDFIEGLAARMSKHDHLETISAKKSLYRIYNDVRFSKDKSPYKPRFAGYLRRVKPMLRGGYYFWIKPGGSHIACGFSYPNAEDLKRVRMDILDNHKEWNKLLKLKSIQSTFGNMQGELVKTSPYGFPKDHPAIDLLRYKQYWFECSFTDKEVLSKDFLSNVNKAFKNIRPFFDHMSEVLTTNLNGESIV
jgi:uncharacterized protein (TIGR02453 family)